jgi:dTDP-4-dehydrorhamnose reductase
MRVLITGKNGQLAQEFAKRLAAPGFEVEAPEEERLDIGDHAAVRAALEALRPEVVLNCAAYNLVDEAERDPTAAFRVNARGVQHLAAACRETGAVLVHYSTDYVFNGQKKDPYTETDRPDPINNYGKSKLAGEAFLRETTDRFLLFRVSWVFGEGKQNFLYKILQMTGRSEVLRIVDDQVSTPTSAPEIVRLTLLAVDKGLSGMYHLTHGGYASRYEVACYLLRKLGMETKVIPVSSDYFPAPARRPLFSALSNKRLSEDLTVEIPHWKIGIDRYAETLS